MSPNVKTLLRIAVSLLVIGAVLTQVDTDELVATWAAADPAWGVAALMLFVADEVVVSLLWHRMLAARGASISRFDTIRFVVGSGFLGLIFPTSQGADVVKIAGLSRYLSNVTEAFTSLTLLRVVGHLILYTIAALVALFFASSLPDDPVIRIARWVAVALPVGIVAVMGAMALLTGPIKGLLLRLGRETLFLKLKGGYDALRFYLSHARVMGTLVLGGLFLQVSKIVLMYWVALMLDLNVPFAAFAIIVPLVNAVALAPVSFGGIGVREGAYTILFAYAGLSDGQAAGLALGGFLVMMAYNGLAAIFYLTFGMPGKETPVSDG
jgi:uncharacterized protein (TIRG00374 family)